MDHIFCRRHDRDSKEFKRCNEKDIVSLCRNYAKDKTNRDTNNWEFSTSMNFSFHIENFFNVE